MFIGRILAAFSISIYIELKQPLSVLRLIENFMITRMRGVLRGVLHGVKCEKK